MKKQNSSESKKDFKRTLSDLIFENSYKNNLFVHEVKYPKKPQTTRGCNFTKVLPTPVKNPQLLVLSQLCCEFLGLDYDKLILESKETAEYLSGNKIIPNSEPVSQCYVGHQFGILAGQLGDGRAITLGDTYGINKDSLWELQLKGSGLTPYSRFADGRAVLRSSIREFLCSEHLWSLGIPTTRALSLVNSDSIAQRDPLYNGHVIDEKCAIVCRVSPSFFRFGSFEIFNPTDPLSGSSGPSVGMENEMLHKMLDYIGKFHFTKLFEECKNKGENQTLNTFYGKLFELICVRTAILAAYWHCYAFCHGVLNTDNMSILGLTIDFGPYGFLEFFDNFFICNHSDKHGRYAYFNQPNMCKWNLGKLAEALSSQLDIQESTKIIENTYEKVYKKYYYFLNTQKLGLFLTHTPEEDVGVIELIDSLYKLLEDFGYDYTLFFRFLSSINPAFNSEEKESNIQSFIDKMNKYSLPYNSKLQKLKPSMNQSAINSLKELKDSNYLILYNYGLDPELVENQFKKNLEYNEFRNNYENSNAYELEKVKKLGDWLDKYKNRLNNEHEKIYGNKIDEDGMKNNFDKLMNDDFMFKYPVSENTHQNILFQNCKNLIEDISTLKMVLSPIDEFNNYKKDYMNSLNPKFILRNHIAQRVIEKAENGDYEELKKVLKIMTSPFEDHEDIDFDEYDTSILLAYDICVSCSS